TVSFTHLLIRTRSFQALVDSTTSRGSTARVSHSGAYSAQNSTQPTGARAEAPTETNNGRSLAASAVAGIASAAANAAAASPAPNISLGLRFIVVAPLPVS